MTDEPYVIERIRDALARDPRTNELELQVQLAHDKVLVSGSVASEERRVAVGEVVAEVCPEREVHNATRVVGSEPAESVEELT